MNGTTPHAKPPPDELLDGVTDPGLQAVLEGVRARDPGAQHIWAPLCWPPCLLAGPASLTAVPSCLPAPPFPLQTSPSFCAP